MVILLYNSGRISVGARSRVHQCVLPCQCAGFRGCHAAMVQIRRRWLSPRCRVVRRLERRQLAWCCSFRVIPASAAPADPAAPASAPVVLALGRSGVFCARRTPDVVRREAGKEARRVGAPHAVVRRGLRRLWFCALGRSRVFPGLSPTCMVAGRRYAEDAECRYASCLVRAAPSSTSRQVSVTSMVLIPRYCRSTALRCLRVSRHSSSGMP